MAKKELTDDQMADGVINGLAGYMEFSCDCGKEHHVPPQKYDGEMRSAGWRPRKFVDCSCGGRHSWSSIQCKCGSRWEYGPRAGWRCVFRKHSLWKARELGLTGRIAFLEAQLAE